MHYILDEDGNPKQEPDLIVWARWFQEAERTIARDELPGEITVSTVFLGLDHNFFPGGPPLLFETMIFGGKHDEYQERYATREDALVGHARALEIAMGRAEP